MDFVAPRKFSILLFIPFALSFGVLLTFQRQAHAATVTWTAGSGVWENGTSWSGGSPPGAGDDAVINSNVTVDINVATTINSLTLGNSGGTTAPTLRFDYNAIGGTALVIDDGDLTIYSGATVSHIDGTSSVVGTIYIDVQTGNATISGTVNIDARGYTGGAGFANGNGPGPGLNGPASTAGGGGGNGGAGGTGEGYSNSGGAQNGLLSGPTAMGSGGGGGEHATGTAGDGGGAIKMDVEGTVTINGVITADGANANGGCDRCGGGGSGGSVYITAGSILGSGSIGAIGGNGGSGNSDGGGGGGGRITLLFTTSYSSSLSLSVAAGSDGSPNIGGNPNSTDGSTGTSYFRDTTNDDLYIIGTNGIWNGSDLADWTFRNMTINASTSFYPSSQTLLTITSTGTTTIASGITVTIGKSYSTDTNGVGVYFNLTGDVTIPATTTFTGDALGYAAGTGSVETDGSGPGAGQVGNTSTDTGGGGGGHGGAGGIGEGNAGSGGVAYGSATNPIALGSGGASGTKGVGIGGAGGAGGSAIRIQTSGILTVSGVITMDGEFAPDGTDRCGGGGSGGSIWLSANIIDGSGSLTATGGDGGSHNSDGGGGAGGRISLQYSDSYTNNLTISVAAGADGTPNIGGSPNSADGSAGTTNTEGIAQTPVDLAQYKSDGTTSIATGDTTNETTVVVKFSMDDGSGSDTLTPKVEVRPTGTAFTDTLNYIGTPTSFSGTAVTGSVTVSDNWFSDSWSKRIPFDVFNPTANSATNHDVRLYITYDSDMQADFDDLRFTNTSGTELNYWVESYTASTSAYVWVEIASLPASGSTILYMYFGNGSVSTTGSSSNFAFIYTEDFAGVSIDPSLTYGGGTTTQNEFLSIVNGADAWDTYVYTTTHSRVEGKSIQAKFKADSGARAMIGWHDSGAGVSYIDLVHAIYFNGGNNSIYVYEDTTSRGEVATYTPGSWYDIKITLRSTGAYYYLKLSTSNDWNLIYTSAYSSESNLRMGAVHYDVTEYSHTDDWYIYQSNTGEAGISSGSEETQSTGILSDLTNYHWQAQVCDAASNCSGWESYGGNAESATDFRLVLNTAPDAPTSLGPASLVGGGYTSDNTPTPTFTINDPDTSDQVRFRIQIDDGAGFGSPVVDYTSAYADEGSRSFTVGQDAGTGSYTTGSSGQTLSDTSYYWRVLASDDDLAASSYSTANGGSVAFIVDSTVPTTPGTPSSDESPTTDDTPTLTWTASTDGGSGLATNAYTLEWCTTSTFSGCSSNTQTSTTNSLEVPDSLDDDTWYFRVKATDSAGNESSYSEVGEVEIDTANPLDFDLISPSDKSYTSAIRPKFKWEAAQDNGSGIDTYEVDVDNGDSGDFTFSDIPSSYNKKTYTTSKYTAKYYNFSNSDNSDDEIEVQAKAGSAWGDSSNGGKLKEGKRKWRVTAIDSSQNELASDSNTLFVDLTGPDTDINQFDNTSSDTTPTIGGRVTDELKGDKDENKVASGPVKAVIEVESGGSLVTLITYNFDTTYFTNGLEITNNSLNSSNKYADFSYTLPTLSVGTYTITVYGEDLVGNVGDSVTVYLTITEELPAPVEELPPVTEEEPPVTEVPPPSDTVITDITDTITDALEEVTDTISDLLSDASNIISDLVGNVADNLEAAVNALPDLIAGIVEVVTDPIIALINELQENIVITAEVWFGTEPTTISGVRVIEVGKDYAVIYWTTNHHATSKVNYGLTYDYGNDVSSNEKVKTHKLKITGLKENTTYYYEVMSQNKNYVYDARHEFETTNGASTVLEDVSDEETDPNPITQAIQEVSETPQAAVITTVALSAPAVPIAVSTVSWILSLLQQTSVFRLPGLIAGFFKKKKHPWGVVYDTKTKEPIDPAIITLKDRDGKEYQAVSDIYGRYEFLVEPGTYQLNVKKTDYNFPPTEVEGGKDPVYESLYLGGTFEVKGDEKVAFNIPMDPVAENWNQKEKSRLRIGTFNKRLHKLTSTVFYLGLVLSALFFAYTPNKLNGTVLTMYLGVTAFRLIRLKVKPWGTILNEKAKPIHLAVVKLINIEIPQLSYPPVVTKESGRYNFLVDKGSYQVALEVKNPDGLYKEIYRTDKISIPSKFGSIGKDIKVTPYL